MGNIGGVGIDTIRAMVVDKGFLVVVLVFVGLGFFVVR